MTELLLSDARATLQDFLAWMVCIAALIWGAGPERAVALVWLVFFETLPAGYEVFTGINLRLEDVVPFFAVADMAAVICWITIALYANRNYTLWIAAMQVLAMTAHLARGLVEAISPVAYVTMVAVPGWLQLLMLAVGLGRHILRKRKFGSYRDWRLNVSLPAVASEPFNMNKKLGLQSGPEPTWRDDLK